MNEVRLIDANALKERVNRTIDYAIDEFDKGYNIGIQKAVDLIDNAPTVNGIVGFVERPKGKWKFIQGATTQGSLKCPFCDYRDYHKTNSNFCSNCGADMRGDNK